MPAQVKAISSGRPRRTGLAWPLKGVLALLGVGVLAASAHIAIPFWPVPMTMESGTVLLLGAAYGPGLAEATLLAYLAAGAIGLPVFAAGAGLAYLAGPTAGYLLGFLAAASFMGFCASRGWMRGVIGTVVAFLAGTRDHLRVRAGLAERAAGHPQGGRFGAGAVPAGRSHQDRDGDPAVPRRVHDPRSLTRGFWGERWGSNPRHPRPQPGALPTELRPPIPGFRPGQPCRTITPPPSTPRDPESAARRNSGSAGPPPHPERRSACRRRSARGGVAASSHKRLTAGMAATPADSASRTQKAASLPSGSSAE